MLLSLCLFLSASDPIVVARLRGYESDLSPQAMSALVVDPAGALMEVADDATQPVFVRARAVALFGHYLESRTYAALLRISRSSEVELRVKALKGLRFVAQKMPTTASDPLFTAALSERLADSDRFVRMQAVRVAAIVPAQHAVLVSLRANEADAGVRRTLDEVLR